VLQHITLLLIIKITKKQYVKLYVLYYLDIKYDSVNFASINYNFFIIIVIEKQSLKIQIQFNKILFV